MPELKKAMIVNLLGRKLGFRSYLELATPSTGRFFHQIDRDYFEHVARMMYVTPFVFDDGMAIDFRSPDEDITGVLEDCRQSGRTVDISLVDAWHTYRTAYRDLVQMFDLLNDGGILVVHDCLPPTREGASPTFRRGSWWGVSYKAFLDFVLQNPSLDYFTVDCDHGCGVIIKNRAFGSVMGPDAPSGWLPDRPDKDLVTRWLDLKSDVDLAYSVFEEHRTRLLRLIPAESFLALFAPEAVENELERRASKPPVLPHKLPPEKPTEKQPKAQTEKPAKAQPRKLSKNPSPRIVDRLLRLLQRKMDSMTGRKSGATPSKAKSVRRSAAGDLDESHQGQDR
jgi:hypothetical protein